MLVDARQVLLNLAQQQITLATTKYLDSDLSDVEDENLRRWWLHNRLVTATNLLESSVQLIRLAVTKELPACAGSPVNP